MAIDLAGGSSSSSSSPFSDPAIITTGTNRAPNTTTTTTKPNTAYAPSPSPNPKRTTVDPILLRTHADYPRWHALARSQATLCGLAASTSRSRPAPKTLFEFYPWLLVDCITDDKTRARVRTVHGAPRLQIEWTEWIPNAAMEREAEEKWLTAEQRERWNKQKEKDEMEMDRYRRELWGLSEWKGWVRRSVSSEILKGLDMEHVDMDGVILEVRRRLGRMVEVVDGEELKEEPKGGVRLDGGEGEARVRHEPDTTRRRMERILGRR